MEVYSIIVVVIGTIVGWWFDIKEFHPAFIWFLGAITGMAALLLLVIKKQLTKEKN